MKYLYLNVITIFGKPIDTPGTPRLALKVAAEGKLKVLMDQVAAARRGPSRSQRQARSGIGKVVLTL